MPDSPGARRAGLWGLAGAATLFSLALAEGALRLLPVSGDRIRARQEAQLGSREIHPRGLYRLDPRIGWALQPGFSSRFRGDDFDVQVKVNPEGLRDRAFPAKPLGTVRLLGLGDSFAFGWGVESHESFLKVLERLLRREDGTSIEVVNAGIPGFGTYEELQLLRAIGLRYEPDLVLLAFYEGNDHQNNGEAPRHRAIEDGYLRDAPRGSGAGRWFLSNSALLGLADASIAGFESKRQLRADVARTERLLGEMKSLLEEKGIPLVLLLIPDQDPDFYGRSALLREYDRLASGMTSAQARSRIRGFCAARGVPYCQLSSRFEGVSSGLRLKDTHFNRAGHALAAEELLACLREQGALSRSRAEAEGPRD